MVDIPGDNTTTRTITVGGTTNDTLEVVGDHDWFRIQLTAGQSISIALDGLTLEDPYLRIYNSAGTLIYENDDTKPGIDRDSLLAFTASYTGTYYIDVGAWDENYTGTYQLSVSAYTPPPVATVDQVANQLVEGYWSGDDHHFNVTQGGTITVNLTGLTAAGQTLAREALAVWTDVTGVTFTEVSTGGQMLFQDHEEGAFSDGDWSNGIISAARVNVSTQWLQEYGTGLNSYSFQAYIHEIGHALGLGHAGNYNESARYPYDAQFENDGWPVSIMSYFDQQENSYFAGQGFSEFFIVTPMLADIVAMSTLYGLSTTTRTGDTTYGFNSNAGRAQLNASIHPNVAYTIVDSGGTDTLDYSGFSTNQRINLNPETFSNVGNGVGNVSIARGVVIENAIGGSGADTFIGNAANNLFNGGAGNDTVTYESAAARVHVDMRTSGAQNTQAAGVDTLISIETVVGSRYNDVLTGSSSDIMRGALGNDTYNVFSSATRAIELAGQGSDTVLAQVDYVLETGSAIEALRAAVQAGTSPLRLTGNDLGQTIIGNAGNNVLEGLGGNDHLIGAGGTDTLFGGPGNDIYRVNSSLDRALESAGGGNDLVLATVSFALESGSEIEALRSYKEGSRTTLNLTGNEYGQTIVGNAGDNVLKGLGGNDYLIGAGGTDTLFGGAGNDTYRVNSAGDRALESAGRGTDTVLSTISYALEAGFEIEALRAYDDGSTTAIDLTGNNYGQTIVGNDGANLLRGLAGNDTLIGRSGNDRLDGGSGSDRLTGGPGSDTFLFKDLGGIDTITDFVSGNDFIDLSGLDANSLQTGDQSFAYIGDAAFSNVAGQLRSYSDEGSNYLAGDVNGDGVADFTISLGSSFATPAELLL